MNNQRYMVGYVVRVTKLLRSRTFNPVAVWVEKRVAEKRVSQRYPGNGVSLIEEDQNL